MRNVYTAQRYGVAAIFFVLVDVIGGHRVQMTAFSRLIANYFPVFSVINNFIVAFDQI